MGRPVILVVMLAVIVAGCGGEDNPTAPATGSCCARDGSCTLSVASGCVGGVWTADLPCVPNTCAKPAGACCHSDGSCAVTVAADCTGPWTMFGTCAIGDCTLPDGACCNPDGTCAITVAAHCTSAWAMFGICDPNPCQQPSGSCCGNQDGSCAVTLQIYCPDEWDWTVFGSCDPNPCPPTGACCNPSSGGCSVTLQSFCPIPEFEWTLVGTCDPFPCVPTGPCCYQDGSCAVTLADDCSGVWTMFGICDSNPCPQPTGSCCANYLICRVTTQADCEWIWTAGGLCDPHPCDYLPQTSPENVLINLHAAYSERKIDAYRRLFTEDFTFVFSPLDPEDPDHPNPDSWGLVDEIEATKNMFEDELVTKVEFTGYTMGVPEVADSLYYGPDAWRVRVDEVNLQVATRLPDGDLLTLVVQGTTEVFYFYKDDTRRIGGRPSWYILRWEDQPIGLGKTEVVSWGNLKARFR